MSALALVAASALAGMACAAAITPRKTLADAGTMHDDGSGLLANASAEDTLITLLQPRAVIAPGTGHATYGGRVAHGPEFGGTRYGNYQYDWGKRGLLPLPERHHGRGYLGADIPPHAHGYGTIRGKIVWKQPPRVSKDLRAAVDGCPSRLENPTLRVDADARVGNVVVYLEDISAGRPGLVAGRLEPRALQLGGTLRIEDCQFLPQVQILSPAGSKLTFIGESEAPGDVIMTLDGNTVLRLPLARGIPASVAFRDPGFWHVEDTRSPLGAWVIVAAHPYYTVSADDGTFRVYDVPPGTYTLVVWHQPVAFETQDGTVVHGEPLVHKTRIRVSADQDLKLNIKLPRAAP